MDKDLDIERLKAALDIHAEEFSGKTGMQIKSQLLYNVTQVGWAGPGWAGLSWAAGSSDWFQAAGAVIALYPGVCGLTTNRSICFAS